MKKNYFGPYPYHSQVWTNSQEWQLPLGFNNNLLEFSDLLNVESKSKQNPKKRVECVLVTLTGPNI